MKALQILVNKQLITIGGMFLLILSLVLPFSTSAPSAQAANDKIVLGYYTSWAPPENLDPNKLTHVTYAFADVCWDGVHGNPNNEEIPNDEPKTWQCRDLSGDLYEDAPTNGTIVLYDYETDLVELPKLEALKQVNPNLKTIVSVGGWTLSNNLSLVAATEETRETFAKSAVDFVREFNLDGLDLDWEYPNAEGHPGNNKAPEDKENHTLILQAVRDAFNVAGKEDGKDYQLSIAGAQTWAYAENNELAKIGEIVDFAMIMAYDTNGTWTGLTGHNAPVFLDDLEAELRGWHSGSADSSSNMYNWEGIPANKIVLGVPFYGHAWAGCNEENNGAFNPANGAYQSCKAAWEKSGDVPGTVGYGDAKELIGKDGYEYYFDDVAKAPYLYNAQKGEFISYDNIETLEHKMNLIKSKGLGGAMIWDLTTDDADYNLLKTVSYNLGVSDEQPVDDPNQPREEQLKQSAQVNERLSVKAKQKITISADNEQAIQFQVPSDLPENTKVTVSEADASTHVGSTPADLIFAGNAFTFDFDFGEADYTTEEQFLIKLPIPAHLTNGVTLGSYNNETNSWEVVDGSFIRDGSLVAVANKLTTYGILISPELVYDENSEEAFQVYPNGIVSNENNDFVIQLPVDLPLGTTFSAKEVDREELVTDGLTVAGKVFDFKFDFNGNEAYSGTFILTLKADKNASYPLVFKLNEDSNGWDEIGGTLTDGNVSVEVDGFSTYGIFTKDIQQGEDGNKGETGDQGDKGETGDKGPQGDKGEAGDKGPQGDKGETGDKGPIGNGGLPTDTDDQSDLNNNQSSSETKNEQTNNGKTQSNAQQSGSKLPNTATSTFNLLLFGVVLLVIGGTSFYYIQRRKG